VVCKRVGRWTLIWGRWVAALLQQASDNVQNRDFWLRRGEKEQKKRGGACTGRGIGCM